MQNKKSTNIIIITYAYFFSLIIAMILLGPSLIFYILFAILAALFILPDQHLLGLSLIIVLTMIFERYFTLQGLVIDKTIFKFYLLDIIICFSYLALFINYKIGKQPKRKIFGLPEKILAIWLILVAVYLARSVFDINADFEPAFSSFKNYFFYPLLYFFVIHAIDSGGKFKDTVHLILLTAVGIIAFIFIGLISGQGLWTEFTPLSTVGTRYLAGTHAFYLTLAFAMGLPLLIYNRLRNKTFALGIMSLWMLGITVSLMRHLWLALAISLAAVFVLFDRKLKKTYLEFLSRAGLIAATIIIITIFGANLLYFQDSMDNINRDISALSSRIATIADLSTDTSANWRQDIWHDAKKAWLTNPVYGVGFGHTILVDNGTYQTFEEIRNIHNSPLAIAVQMGLIGILVFLVFVASVIIFSYNNIYVNDDLKPYFIGIIAAISIFMTVFLFQPYLETNMMSIWLWILLGLLRTSSIKKE